MIATTGIGHALRYCGGSHTAADIDAAVDRGDLQRWEGDCSTIITEIKQTPQKRSLNFFLAEGNLRELEAMLPPILEWGKAQGCTGAYLVGRAGWQRSFLTRLGWKPAGIVMEVALG